MAHLVDRYDPGVLKLAAYLRLLREATNHCGVVLLVRQQHLDGEVASKLGVMAAQHTAHPTPTNFLAKLVASEPRRQRWGSRRRYYRGSPAVTLRRRDSRGERVARGRSRGSLRLNRSDQRAV